jgi:hypothetical protein
VFAIHDSALGTTQGRIIWDVVAPSSKLNERVVGITGPNPFDSGRESWVNAMFHARLLSTVGGTTVSGLRIYGSMMPSHFPPLGFGWESLCHWRTLFVSSPVKGFARTPTVSSEDFDKGEAPGLIPAFPMQILPRYLLLEYSTNNIGTSVRFQVRSQILGLEIEATQ